MPKCFLTVDIYVRWGSLFFHNHGLVGLRSEKHLSISAQIRIDRCREHGLYLYTSYFFFNGPSPSHSNSALPLGYPDRPNGDTGPESCWGKNKTNLKEHEQMKGKKEKCAWRNWALTDFGAIIFAWLRWDLIIFRIMQLLMGRPGRAEVCSMLFS